MSSRTRPRMIMEQGFPDGASGIRPRRGPPQPEQFRFTGPALRGRAVRALGGLSGGALERPHGVVGELEVVAAADEEAEGALAAAVVLRGRAEAAAQQVDRGLACLIW